MSKKLNIEKSKKQQKWRIFSNDEIMDSVLRSAAHIELFGSSRIEVEGCDGIYEYGTDYLKLRLKKGALVVTGTDFDIVTFENKAISVRGAIKSIEFCD